jgi:hypothetical protein
VRALEKGGKRGKTGALKNDVAQRREDRVRRDDEYIERREISRDDGNVNTIYRNEW